MKKIAGDLFGELELRRARGQLQFVDDYLGEVLKPAKKRG